MAFHFCISFLFWSFESNSCSILWPLTTILEYKVDMGFDMIPFGVLKSEQLVVAAL